MYQQGSSLYSIIDTGATALNISVLFYESLVLNLFDYAGVTDWQYKDGTPYTACENEFKMPSIYFHFDGKWIEARPRDYFGDYTGRGEECMLFIAPISSPMNILGLPVLIDYYTMHDVEKGTISWAPHTGSSKKDIIEGEVIARSKLADRNTKAEAEVPGRGLLFWL